MRNLGLVEGVFDQESMDSWTGDIALGHARYGTAGRGELHEVQPFLINFPFGLGMIHNGNIVNTQELSDYLAKRNRRLLTRSDSEIVLNLFADALSQFATADPAALTFDQICLALREVYTRVVGSFSIAALIAGHGLIAFRDPNGIRPLIWGKRKASADHPSTLPSQETHLVASESVVLPFLNYEKVRDIAPGEVLFINQEGKVFHKVLAQKEHRPCMFEWVYFASPETEMDGSPVYGARIQLGKNLASIVAKELAARGITADLIVPVPETSRIAAIALAEELKIPYRELLIKNRYIKRTFILNSQEKRQKAVNLKLSPVRSEIKGKRIVLVDDSIVRGTTSKKIIELVRSAGASQVIFVSTCPPIEHPCFYGIDFPDQEELIAYGRTLPEIEKELGADAVIYQDHEGLRSAVGQKNPCMACLDGNYPTDVSGSATLMERRTADRRSGKIQGRIPGKGA